MNKTSSIPKWLAIIIISCVGGLVYSNTFHCSFHYDDNIFITHNPVVRDIRDLPGIWKFFPCRFFTLLSFALSYHFYHLDVIGYHLLNIAVHLATGVLVWWLALLTFSTPAMKEVKTSLNSGLVALLAGLVFVSHPLQTESVTYIWQRGASLATLFYLASLCFFIKSRLERNSLFYYICSLIAALIAMFTKEIVVTLPLLILLYDYTFINTSKSLKRGYLLPFLSMILIIPAVTLLTHSENVQYIHGSPAVPEGISPIQYILTQLRVMVTYIRLVFIPLNQNLDYDYHISKSFLELPVLFSFLFLTTIFVLALRLYTKYRLFSFSLFWFFLASLPEAIPFPVKDVIFEHRLYLPLVGYCLLLVSGITYLQAKFNIRPMIILLFLVITCNSILTYQRNKIWKDDLSLWSDTVTKSPHKARAYNGRGLGFKDQGNYDLAMADYKKAIALNPHYPEALTNLGVIYEELGKNAQAILEYNRAIAISFGFSEPYYNRGVLYKKTGQLSQAISDFTKAIEIRPNDSRAYCARAIVYSQQNNIDRAFSDFKKGIDLDPDNAQILMDFGVFLGRQGHLPEAVTEFNKALEIKPDFKEAYNNRAIVYRMLKEQEKEIKK